MILNNIQKLLLLYYIPGFYRPKVEARGYYEVVGVDKIEQSSLHLHPVGMVGRQKNQPTYPPLGEVVTPILFFGSGRRRTMKLFTKYCFCVIY